MANDQPFVELPSPPRSPAQPVSDANKRGWDYASTLTGDEYEKAIAYLAHIQRLSLIAERNLRLLTGNPATYAQLVRKTLALARNAPTYVEYQG